MISVVAIDYFSYVVVVYLLFLASLCLLNLQIFYIFYFVIFVIMEKINKTVKVVSKTAIKTHYVKRQEVQCEKHNLLKGARNGKTNKQTMNCILIHCCSEYEPG